MKVLSLPQPLATLAVTRQPCDCDPASTTCPQIGVRS